MLLFPALMEDVLAACTATQSGIPVPMPVIYRAVALDAPISFNPDVPNGTILFGIQMRAHNGYPNNALVTCPNGIATVHYRGTSPLFDPHPHVYMTGISGVGIMIVQKRHYPIQFNRTKGVTEEYHDQYFYFDLLFVKMGPITAGGTLAGQIAGYFVEDGATQSASIVIEGGIAIRPLVPTCTVSSPSILVPMDSVPARTFTHVGSTSQSRDFNIRLSCTGGNTGSMTNPHVTLTDVSNPGNTSTTLPLTADSTAAGLGIQILRNGRVLGFGPDSSEPGTVNQWRAGTVPQGVSTFTIPLSARYVQTARQVTPGTANGRATFTMSYQ